MLFLLWSWAIAIYASKVLLCLFNLFSHHRWVWIDHLLCPKIKVVIFLDRVGDFLSQGCTVRCIDSWLRKIFWFLNQISTTQILLNFTFLYFSSSLSLLDYQMSEQNRMLKLKEALEIISNVNTSKGRNILGSWDSDCDLELFVKAHSW